MKSSFGKRAGSRQLSAGEPAQTALFFFSPTASPTHRNRVQGTRSSSWPATGPKKQSSVRAAQRSGLFLNQIKYTAAHSEDRWTVRYPYDRRRFVATGQHENKWSPGHRTLYELSCTSVHALSATNAGCTQEARYTAADMSVLGGGGNHATGRGRYRDSLTGRKNGLSRRTRKVSTGITRHSARRAHSRKRRVSRRERVGLLGSHEAVPARSFSAQRDRRGGARMTTSCAKRGARCSGSRLDSRRACTSHAPG